MKNLVKLVGITAFVAIIGFSMIGCDLNNNDYELLNGVWDRGDIVVTFNNDNGFFTEIKSISSTWLPLLNNGTIHIGDRKFRNIKKTGDLKWTCQNLAVPDGSTTSTTWEECTIIVNSSGQTLQTYTPNTTNLYSTYTRK